MVIYCRDCYLYHDGRLTPAVYLGNVWRCERCNEAAGEAIDAEAPQ